VNYYNRDLSALEPAIEPFICICDWRFRSDRSGGDCATFEVHSPDTINVNLTVPLVSLMQLIVDKTRSASLRKQRRRTPFVPFCLSNQTGVPLRFKKVTDSTFVGGRDQSPTPDVEVSDPEDEWVLVEPDAEIVDLPFQPALTATGRAATLKQGTNQQSAAGRPPPATPRLMLEVEGWLPAYPVALDRLGVFYRTIRLRKQDSAQLDPLFPQLTPLTRLVIEIVRRGSAQNLVIVRSGLTVTNRLSPRFDLEVGLAVGPLQQSGPALPSRLPVAPAGPGGLQIPFGETRPLPLPLASRAAGRLCFRPVCADAKADVFFDWSQQVCPVVPDVDQEEGDAVRVKSVGLRPAVSPDEVMDWRKLTKSGEADECVVLCRRLRSGSDIGLYSATSGESLSRQPDLPSPWQLCVNVVREAFPPDPLFRGGPSVLPGHHVTVGPVLRLVNLLPCELSYFVDGTPIHGRLPANKAASIFEVSCVHALRFGVYLDGFQRCQPIYVPPVTFSETVLISLFDHFGRSLQLKAEMCTKAYGVRHVTITAVCWLINNSGLPLVFAQQASSNIASPNEWKAPGSPEHRALAAGQSLDQELARLASPLLFSPLVGTAAEFPPSWSLQVRIGAHHSPTEGDSGTGVKRSWVPRWSPPVALDKNDEALLLRLKSTYQDRPDLLYSVGVEVRKGGGLHSATTIVTFVPRFVISNQTNFQLQFAQRFCVDSTTYRPMDVHPQCSLPFHWPRQDLDQILCFRALLAGDTWLPDQRTSPTLVATHWSGGVQIDKPRSYHLMLRMPARSRSGPSSSSVSTTAAYPEPLFLRVDIVLRSATLFVIVSDATHLPPPYRIENQSPVALFYQQAPMAGVEMPPQQASYASSRGSNGRWSGGIFLSRLPPRSTVSYAPDEPLLPPQLSVGVHGDLSYIYDLSKPGPGPRLVYDNCVYVSVCGVAGDDVSTAGVVDFPVLDVPLDDEEETTAGVKRVLLRRKRPGERSQLWYVSSQGYLVHEGSAAPQAPRGSTRQRGRVLSARTWVLDVDTSTKSVANVIAQSSIDPRTLENFEVGVLCLARLSKRRQNTQSWVFERRGFLMNAASFCVQAKRRNPRVGNPSADTGEPIFVARPRFRGQRSAVSRDGGSGGVIGRCLLSESLAAARISYTWLRPGSGSLCVEVLTEGPVRVLRISDPQECDQPANQTPFTTKARPGSEQPQEGPTSLRLLIDLPSGLGVSVMSAHLEELCYASLMGLRLSLDRFYPGGATVNAASTIDGALPAIGQETAEDVDVVFVEAPHSTTSRSEARPAEKEYPSSCRARCPVEQAMLSIERIQVDNQIAGASLPVLLFRAPPVVPTSTSGAPQTSRSVVEGRPIRTTDGGEWIRRRELERLLQGDLPPSTGSDTAWHQSSSSSSSPPPPNLITRSLRLLHTGWNAEIFTLFELQLNKMVIQAEELLLLKLIQFSRNFGIGSRTIMAKAVSTEDAKLIDFLQEGVVEAEGAYSRQISPPTITSRDFFYFDRLRVLFAPIRVTVQTAEGRLGPEFNDVKRLLPKLMSFTDADLRLGEFERRHCLESGRFLVDQLALHFELQLRAQALRIFGSVDLLGNPLGFMSDISSGISDLADMDLSGLVRNVAHGVGDSTAKVVGTMSQLVHTLSMDEGHQRQRRAIMASGGAAACPTPSSSSSSEATANRASASLPSPLIEEGLDEFELTASVGSADIGEASKLGLSAQTAAFRAGLRGFVHGIVGGVTSIVTQPIHGACEEDSLKGFVYGVGRGLLGTVTKPVGGVLDLVSGAMTSLRETARPSSSGRPRRMRPRRALSAPLRPYSLVASIGQMLLRRFSTHPRPPLESSSCELVSLLVENDDNESHSFSSLPVSKLLKASAGTSSLPREGEQSEMVIRVLPCQLGTVNVIVTDRAVWCVRNLTLNSSTRTSSYFFCGGRDDTTRVMFVIPYRNLNFVRLQNRPQKPPGSPADSFYVEFLSETRRQVLRFDRADWARDLLSEVSEAHFRFVQTVMSLRRNQSADLPLRGHPHGQCR
uniref:SHR-BD domain-containing protein n=1 Tax=Mesocestoides corti TaxID=53468 RepID=A0A5K3FAP5_MESCO